jgi:hypothetical protein
LKKIFRDQDELVGLNASIEDSKEALRKGRGAVGEAVLGAAARQAGDTSAVAMLQAGRQEILQQMDAVSQAAQEVPFDAISARVLADQLHAELIRLTTSVPEDRLAAKSLEIQIQTTLRSYSNAIHRLLSPLKFR